MAYVKIIPCKTKSPTSTIDYVTEKENLNHNPNKEILKYISNKTKVFQTSHFNCINGLESKQFKLSQNLYAANKNYKVRSDNIGYFHVIQSFKPNETTPSQAHEIGQKFIMKHFGSNAQVVMATHTDKEHIHNHFVVNSVSMSGKKFYFKNETLKSLRRCSDEICREYNLSVIKPKEKGVNYKEWKERNNETSWKEEVKTDIDLAILQSNNYSEFKKHMQQMGYEFKEPRKHLTLRKKGNERYVRGYTLGLNYTEQRIKERISNANKLNIVDATNNNLPTSIPVFISKKRKEYIAINAVLALQHLSALEILFRLLLNNAFKERKKFDIRKPYIVWNDYAIRMLFKEILKEENKAKKKYQNINQENKIIRQ